MNLRIRASTAFQPVMGIAIVAAVYVYFLIFAQFAFLQLATARGFTPDQLRGLMAGMGVAGIAASVVSAQRLKAGNPRGMLFFGFFGAAAAAGLAVVATHLPTFCFISALIGASVGMLTVTLAATLVRLFGSLSIGRCAGLGTGLAYALCNLPGVFAGSPAFRAGVAAIACLIGLAAAALAEFRDEPEPPSSEVIESSTRSFGMLVLMFLALVWLDSAAFYILQNSPALNRFGWGGSTLQWENAGIHFAAALIAGWLIDRGRLTRLPLAAALFLGGAAVCVSSDREMFARATNWLYAAGVSLYSVALVCAAVAGCGRDLKRPARRAAVLFSVAGWFGSALGIGMAQDLHAIPTWFIALAVATVVIASGWRARPMDHPAISIVALVAFVLGAVIVLRAAAPGAKIPPEPPAQMGREVYIAEGCIHCHSQYIRPGTADEEWWGPVHSPSEILQQSPPLIGNRRQGPDLLNAGNRRSIVWNRIHLIEPQAVSPGSVMPSYAHLFRGGDTRGDSLLAYLADLGADSIGDRLRTRAEWSPAAGDSVPPGSLGHDLFQRNCTQCHGASGLGNGPLAGKIGGWQPRNLTLAEWTQLPRHAESRRERIELARVIKFGILGTPMAGHETWSDEQLLATARYVQSLARSTARSEPEVVQTHSRQETHADPRIHLEEGAID